MLKKINAEHQKRILVVRFIVKNSLINELHKSVGQINIVKSGLLPIQFYVSAPLTCMENIDHRAPIGSNCLPNVEITLELEDCEIMLKRVLQAIRSHEECLHVPIRVEKAFIYANNSSDSFEEPSKWWHRFSKLKQAGAENHVCASQLMEQNI